MTPFTKKLPLIILALTFEVGAQATIVEPGAYLHLYPDSQTIYSNIASGSKNVAIWKFSYQNESNVNVWLRSVSIPGALPGVSLTNMRLVDVGGVVSNKISLPGTFALNLQFAPGETKSLTLIGDVSGSGYFRLVLDQFSGTTIALTSVGPAIATNTDCPADRKSVV